MCSVADAWLVEKSQLAARDFARSGVLNPIPGCAFVRHSTGPTAEFPTSFGTLIQGFFLPLAVFWFPLPFFIISVFSIFSFLFAFGFLT